MSFTVLRVEVQQWKDEGISLPVGGQSEEGVEADDVVEEEGHQEDCGHVRVIEEEAVLSVFIIRAEGHGILDTLFIDPLQSFTIIKGGVDFTRWRLVVFEQFDRQVQICHNISRGEEDVEDHDGHDH